VGFGNLAAVKFTRHQVLVIAEVVDAGAEIFLKSIEKMRRVIPNLTLRTSFIVGFPGETEQDFTELCEFVKAAQFDWLGVFSYSDEEGSGAFHHGEKIPRRLTETRRRKLMQIQRQISKSQKRKLIGRQFEVLALGPSDETELLWEGRTEMHAPEIDGKLFINDFGDHQDLVSGEFYSCEITEAHDYDLVARIV
jgi:ribosomal protein S12 methylthiotransferase